MAYAEKYRECWYIRYKNESGRWRRKSCGSKATRADADYLASGYSAKEMNRRHKAPVKIVTSSLTDCLILFRDTVLPQSTAGIDKQESTISREKSAINNFITFIDEMCLKKFNAIDKDMAQAFLSYRAKDGMSPKTRREELRVLKKFFKWAVKQYFCSEDPTKDIIAPKLQKKKPRYFSEDELKEIFSRAKDPYTVIFKFLYLTGLRTGELCNLEWRDYNSKQKTLTIRIISANKKLRTPGNKTGGDNPALQRRYRHSGMP